MTRSWLKPCSTKNMLLEEKAWLAGFIDGEGTIGSYMSGRNHLYKSWIISVPNTDINSLEKCVKITGVGRVKKKSSPKSERHKQVYQWQVTSQKDIKSICDQILPFCAIKGDQINKFLSQWVDVDGNGC